MFIEVKLAEISDLINRGTFRAVIRTELSGSASMITARSVQTIKSREYKRGTCEARYVAGGHHDVLKDYLLHRAQTIKFLSVRMILVKAIMNNFHFWIIDEKPHTFNVLSKRVYDLHNQFGIRIGVISRRVLATVKLNISPADSGNQ